MNLGMRSDMRLGMRFLCLVLTLAMGAPVRAKFGGLKAVCQAWQHCSSPQYLYPGSGALYYNLELKNGSTAHLVVVSLNSPHWQIKPIIADKTTPLPCLANESKACAAINGGFFNLSDGISTSYVMVSGKEVANPRTNKALIENPKLIPYLEAIFNRSEIRFLQNSEGKTFIDIVPHNTPVPSNLSLVHVLQGGPQLLPQLTDKEEAFLRYDAAGKEIDAIAAKRSAARTAFGIDDDGYAMLLVVTTNGQNKESYGITLKELADLLKALGCSKAINLDGGASSTMFVRLEHTLAYSITSKGELPAGIVVSSKLPETRIKSALLLLPK